MADVSSQATLVPSSMSSNHIPPTMENVEDRLGRRRAPLLVLPSLVLEGVTNTDVDVGEVLLGGLTIAETPTPTIASSSAWSRVHSPSIGAGTRSMSSRNDAVSVLTTHTVQAGITGRVVLSLAQVRFLPTVPSITSVSFLDVVGLHYINHQSG
jgi:hypothetical protein